MVAVFLCDTVADELRRVGIEVAGYSLASEFSPSSNLAVGQDEAALIVNYFGVCSEQIEGALRRLPRDRCVIDNSQAFGVSASECLGTIYSPRKFFGVPDGGLLLTERDVSEPTQPDECSITRCQHLLLRLGGQPEDGRAAYGRAEQSLVGAEHRSMSTLTRRLLASIDYEQAFARRRANFQAMHKLFGAINHFPFNDHTPTSPLTYTLMLAEEGPSLRAALIDQRIFSPAYWPELLDGDTDKLAASLAGRIVHFPIDQRYEPMQLVRRLEHIEALRNLRAKGCGHAK